MSAELCTFWLVWRLDGRSSTFMHSSRESAENEATRLSKNHPGEVFVVLKSATAFHCEVKPPSKFKMIAPDNSKQGFAWESDDEIPF